MSYNRVNWKNLPDETTPLTAENMNKMDEEIWNIENSAAIGKTIINNGGIYTNAYSKSTDDKMQTFTIGPNINGNYGRYCTCEYRTRVQNGNGIISHSMRIFFIVDIIDMGNDMEWSAGNFNKAHCRIVGRRVPERLPRVCGEYGGMLEFGTLEYNEFGTIAFTYNKGTDWQTKNNRYAPMFFAQLWTFAQ